MTRQWFQSCPCGHQWLFHDIGEPSGRRLMGTWHGPTVEYALNRILDRVDPNYMLRSRTGLIDALTASGLIVRTDFYIPDPDELLGMMHRWQYHLRQGMQGCRWVMCRETVDALAEKYALNRTMTPTPRTFDIGFWRDGPGTELPTAALEMEAVQVMESRRYWSGQDMLFGVPIRIDPAARSPLFEIDTPATARRPC